MSEAEQIVYDHFSIPEIKGIDKTELILVTKKITINGKEKNFSCTKNDFKFGLIRKAASEHEEDQLIFEINFFERDKRVQTLFPDNLPTIRLEVLWVQADYRNSKIATYYMKKLVQFAKEREIKQISMVVYPKADIFKSDNKNNSLSESELKKFYLKFEDEDLKIEFLN